MRRVLKYPLEAEPTDLCCVHQVPGESRVVMFARQRGKLHVWLEVDDEDRETANWTSWQFRVEPTGCAVVNPYHEWCASLSEEPYVWHLYGQKFRRKFA